MRELTILGAGIAGSCAYRACLDLGIRGTVVTDNASSASQIALATLHSPNATEAARLYDAWGVPVKHGAWITGYRRRSPKPTWNPAWIAVDPVEALDVPTTTINPGGVTLECTAQPTWGLITWGGTWIHPDSDALYDANTLRIHHYGPYRHITAISWPHGARLGSSVGRTEEAATLNAQQQLQVAHDIGLLDANDPAWTLRLGRRIQAKQILEPGRFGGFHRDGYTLAALHAHQAVKDALQ